MPFYKDIVCLSNSRKLAGHCIAGKEINSAARKIGQWIRPVSSAPTGQLFQQQIMMNNAKQPQMLDVIRVPMKSHMPHGYQTENYLIYDQETWKYLYQLPLEAIPVLFDNVETLWQNGCRSYNGLNDRIPQEVTDNELRSSLLFIKPERFKIIVQ